jgi:hypothetical protein
MIQKFTMRDGSVARDPARNGETAQNRLETARRHNEKTIVIGNTTFLVEDIIEAVDEKSRKGRTNMEGI